MSAYYLAFGKKIAGSVYSLIIFFISASGIFVLLNSELFALTRILAVTGAIVLSLFLFPNIHFKNIEPVNKKGISLFSAVAVSIFTAITTSLTGSTRWKTISVMSEHNNLSLLFTKYLPIIICSIIALSVILISFKSFVEKPEGNGGN